MEGHTAYSHCPPPQKSKRVKEGFPREPLMRRVDSLEKTLMLGGIGGKRRGGRQRMRCMDVRVGL